MQLARPSSWAKLTLKCRWVQLYALMTHTWQPTLHLSSRCNEKNICQCTWPPTLRITRVGHLHKITCLALSQHCLHIASVGLLAEVFSYIFLRLNPNLYYIFDLTGWLGYVKWAHRLWMGPRCLSALVAAWWLFRSWPMIDVAQSCFGTWAASGEAFACRSAYHAGPQRFGENCRLSRNGCALFFAVAAASERLRQWRDECVLFSTSFFVFPICARPLLIASPPPSLSPPPPFTWWHWCSSRLVWLGLLWRWFARHAWHVVTLSHTPACSQVGRGGSYPCEIMDTSGVALNFHQNDIGSRGWLTSWKKAISTLLRVIPTMTFQDAYLEIYSKFSDNLPHIYSGILSGIYSGILSDICSGNLSGNLSDMLSGLLSEIFSDMVLGICFNILSGILFNIYSDILSGILSDIYSGILSDIYSGILSGILLGIYSGSLSDIRGILSEIYFGILPDILSGIHSDMVSGIYILTFYLAFYLAFVLAFYLTCNLAFYLTFYLAFCLTYILPFHPAFFLTCTLAFYQTYVLASHLAFYLAYILAVYLAFVAFYLAFYLTYILAFYLTSILAVYLTYILT